MRTRERFAEFERRAVSPTVHAMCGIVGSGKTTVAKRLARELPALRLSRDEWMLKLHGLAFDDPAYVEAMGPCTELMWDVAARALAADLDVVLDWNHWSRDRRADSLARCTHLGVEMRLHFIDVSVDAAADRALRRRDATSHVLDEDGVRHSATILEVPSDGEGFVVVRHSGSSE